MILNLSADVVDQLIRLLDIAKAVQPGDDVEAKLAPDPWGDMQRFQREVYYPLEARQDGPAHDGPHKTITLTAEEAQAMFDVVHDLSVSWSTGRDWAQGLDPETRAAVDRVQAMLQP